MFDFKIRTSSVEITLKFPKFTDVILKFYLIPKSIYMILRLLLALVHVFLKLESVFSI